MRGSDFGIVGLSAENHCVHYEHITDLPRDLKILLIHSRLPRRKGLEWPHVFVLCRKQSQQSLPLDPWESADLGIGREGIKVRLFATHSILSVAKSGKVWRGNIFQKMILEKFDGRW
jgi:hypothetical protein